MSTRERFKSVLAEQTPLLLDGATGTELYNRGIFINRCFEEANLTNPKLVSDLHREYINAGCHAILTNSWGANAFKLAGHNLKEKAYEINLKAASLARAAAGEECFVGGSVGPLGIRIEPWGPTSFAEAFTAFSEQIKGLVDGGVDFICIETFSDLSEIQQAIAAAKKIAPEIPIATAVTINLRGELVYGAPLEIAIQKLDEWGADIVGINCSVGPQPMLTAIERVKKVTNKPLIVQPNAGLPRQIEGRTIYMSTPEYFGEFTKNFLQAGVQLVGGCCGTTPTHTKIMAQAYRQFLAMHKNELAQQKKFKVEVKSPRAAETIEAERVPLEQKSNWSAKIARGEKVFTIELLPPAGVVIEPLLKKAELLKKAGIDAINIPDGPRASSRMSTTLTAVMIEQRVGIETILHYTCRDRNLIGMQSDLLGAHAIGLRNVLLITGDPPKIGNYPDVTGVFDVDAIGLTNVARQLNGGIDLGHRSIGEPTALSIGVGVNPVHRDFDYEMHRFFYKVDAGAEWAITQPIFDKAAIYRFLDYIAKNNLKIPIIAGIWPLTSLRNAQFMNNEVPGISIPAPTMARMAAAKSQEDATKVGVDIAHEICEELQQVVQGFQISAPFGKIAMALQVIDK